jgi:hypothetical protein
MICCELDVGIELLRSLLCDYSLRFLDMLMSEQELAIQVRKIDCVKVDDRDGTKGGEDKILEEFTAYAPGADKKYI